MNPLTPRKFHRYLRAALPLLALGGGVASARSASTGRRQPQAMVSHQAPQNGSANANPFALFGGDRATPRPTDEPVTRLAQLAGNEMLKPGRERTGRTGGMPARNAGNRFESQCTFDSSCNGGACVNQVCEYSNAAPTGGALTISGTMAVGQILTGSYVYHDANNDAEDTSGSGTSYRWVRADNAGMTTNPTNIASGHTLGANQTYTVQAADAGKYLFFCVTPKANSGTSPGAEACSAATAQVQAGTAVTSVTAPANGSYRTNQNLDFALQFSGAVTVTGTPRIALTVGNSTVYADYLSGSGSNTLAFRYAVQPGDSDSDGIAAASPIDLNSGTIVDGNSQNAILTWTVPTLTGVKVDTGAPAAPTVTAPANASYKSGQNLDFTVTYGENVTVAGTPRIALTIGSSPVYADYLNGSGATALTFRYTVQAGYTDTDGIAAASPIDLNTTGTIKDAAGNDATLTYTVPTLTSVLVDTTAPDKHTTAPITAVDADTSNSYTASDTLTLQFTEPVMKRTAPAMRLMI